MILKNGLLIKYLGLNDLGFIELLFALSLILSGYSLGELPLSALIWVFLLLAILLRGHKIRMGSYKPLLIFAIYWLLHTVVILLVDDVNINGILVQLIYFLAIFSLHPVLDITKLRGAINFVSLIVIVGLFYQWGEIVAHGGTHPLEIPGLTMSKERLGTFSLRPSSFFMEPAAYVGFMLSPIALALIDGKLLWAIFLMLSVFFTSSTTGLVACFVMLAVWAIMQKKSKILLSVAIIALGLFYALTHFSIFETGVEKVNNTDVETNLRLTQGQYVVSTMEGSEFLFGVPYSSAFNYCKSGRAANVIYYGDNVFMPTFWEFILLYGLVGLILYLMIYYALLKRCVKLLPFITCQVLTLFSGGPGIGPSYVFCLVFMLVVSRKYSTVK